MNRNIRETTSRGGESWTDNLGGEAEIRLDIESTESVNHG